MKDYYVYKNHAVRIIQVTPGHCSRSSFSPGQLKNFLQRGALLPVLCLHHLQDFNRGYTRNTDGAFGESYINVIAEGCRVVFFD